MKRKVLWIEDGARFDLPQLAGPVYINGSYDLVVAEDVSTGISHLLRDEFDVVIVDIRLPPGDHPRWIKVFSAAGYNKIQAQLGLQLLYSVLGRPEAEVKLEYRPEWITAAKLGVFTVESPQEMEKYLKQLDIQIFQQKRADLPDTILLELIEKILRKQERIQAGAKESQNPCRRN
jgi:hypothetical protein